MALSYEYRCHNALFWRDGSSRPTTAAVTPVRTIWIDEEEQIRCREGCSEEGRGGNQICIRWSERKDNPGGEQSSKK